MSDHFKKRVRALQKKGFSYQAAVNHLRKQGEQEQAKLNQQPFLLKLINDIHRHEDLFLVEMAKEEADFNVCYRAIADARHALSDLHEAASIFEDSTIVEPFKDRDALWTGWERRLEEREMKKVSAIFKSLAVSSEALKAVRQSAGVDFGSLAVFKNPLKDILNNPLRNPLQEAMQAHRAMFQNPLHEAMEKQRAMFRDPMKEVTAVHKAMPSTPMKEAMEAVAKIAMPTPVMSIIENAMVNSPAVAAVGRMADLMKPLVKFEALGGNGLIKKSLLSNDD